MLQIFNELLNQQAFKKNVKHFHKTINCNEKILEQGKHHSSIYIIIKGNVKITIKEENFKKKLAIRPSIVELGPDDMFGEFALFDDLPSSADVITVTECELIEIDIETLRIFLDNNPIIGYKLYHNILKNLVKHLRHANKSFVNLYVWGLKVHQLDKYLLEDSNEKIANEAVINNRVVSND